MHVLPPGIVEWPYPLSIRKRWLCVPYSKGEKGKEVLKHLSLVLGELDLLSWMPLPGHFSQYEPSLAKDYLTAARNTRLLVRQGRPLLFIFRPHFTQNIGLCLRLRNRVLNYWFRTGTTEQL